MYSLSASLSPPQAAMETSSTVRATAGHTRLAIANADLNKAIGPFSRRRKELCYESRTWGRNYGESVQINSRSRGHSDLLMQG